MKRFYQNNQRGIASTVSILSLLCCSIASAEEPRKVDQNDCPVSGSCLVQNAQKLVGQLFAYPRKFGLAALEQLESAQPPPTYANALGETINVGPSHWDMENITSRDNTNLRVTFRHFQELSLLTLWEDRSYKLHLSLSNDGVAGINFTRKEIQGTGVKTNRYSQLEQPPEIHNPHPLMSAF